MATVFSALMSVRSYEADSFGHVNNAVYLNYLEYARGKYLRKKGLSFHDFQRWNAMPYVVHVELTYKASCRIHDELEIKGWIANWSRAGFTMTNEIHNLSSGRLAVAAELRFAFVDQREKIVAVPEEFKKALQ